jgi:hypothetical protein
MIAPTNARTIPAQEVVSDSFRVAEMPQIRRRLVLLHRHQFAGVIEHVDLTADLDVKVVLTADRLNPDRFGLPAHRLHHRPWPR